MLVAVDEHDGELELAVETTRELVGCPGCGAVAAAHGRRPVRVRDLPVGGRATALIWIKRLWRCRHQQCEVATWSESSVEIPTRASLTARAAREACRRVGHGGESITAVAWDLGLGWGTVIRAVIEHGAPLVDDPTRLAGVTALGVDETAYLAATSTHGTEFATGLVDLTRSAGSPARLLDVVPGRSGAVLSTWLGGRDLGWRAGVQTAALDPFRGYATALRTHLPRAVPGAGRLPRGQASLATRMPELPGSAPRSTVRVPGQCARHRSALPRAAGRRRRERSALPPHCRRPPWRHPCWRAPLRRPGADGEGAC